jgi:hypothetical protein
MYSELAFCSISPMWTTTKFIFSLFSPQRHIVVLTNIDSALMCPNDVLIQMTNVSEDRCVPRISLDTVCLLGTALQTQKQRDVLTTTTSTRWEYILCFVRAQNSHNKSKILLCTTNELNQSG